MAVVINDQYFAASGGNLANVAGTISAGYSLAQSESFAPQFRSVGAFGHCTGTWLGNDFVADKSYFLTAAHCFDDSGTLTSVSASFADYSGNVIASGPASFHVPSERVDRPAGFGGASTDIGIIEMPGVVSIDAGPGQAVPRPVLYDGNQELGTQVSFAGYGSWGIGSQGSNGSYFPDDGPRRATGTNVIDNIFENDHGIAATFDAPGTGDSTVREGAVASGDSGSAWWQQHDGVWTIIGTTNGGSGTNYGSFSTAARVSQWIDWVQSIYPDVQLFSENQLTGVPGDVNQDGVFDDGDLTAFANGWREETSTLSLLQSTMLGDLNYDGRVFLEDWAILQSAMEGGGPRATLEEVLATAIIPEPTTLAALLLCLGCAGVSGRRLRISNAQQR